MIEEGITQRRKERRGGSGGAGNKEQVEISKVIIKLPA